MFALICRYLKPLDEVDRHLDPHIAWIARNAAEGRILLTSSRRPRTGGLMLATAADQTEIEAMIAEDPFIVNGVAEYEILDVEVKRAAPGIERLLDA